jgi:hypothetical protein
MVIPVRAIHPLAAQRGAVKSGQTRPGSPQVDFPGFIVLVAGRPEVGKTAAVAAVTPSASLRGHQPSCSMEI